MCQTLCWILNGVQLLVIVILAIALTQKATQPQHPESPETTTSKSSAMTTVVKKQSIPPPPRLPRPQPPTGPDYDVVLGDLGFVSIPEGSFVTGSPITELGRDILEVQRFEMVYDSFLILATELTESQWNREPQFGTALQTSYLPKTDVSWQEAMGFCEQLGKEYSAYEFRLPTEVEWEYACRAGTTSAFGVKSEETADCEIAIEKWNNGDTDFLRRYVRRFSCFDADGPDLVVARESNAWGLYDMQGNVWEWCLKQASSRDPLAPVRGGAWSTIEPTGCRAAVRGEEYDDTRKPSIGFRVVAIPR